MAQSDGQDNSLFRENAIKKLHSLNQIESTLQIIEPTAWLWIVVAISFFMALFLWMGWGSLSTYVFGNGIILSTNQFEQTEKQMQEGIQQRKEKLSASKILLDKKRKLFNKQYLTIDDIKKSEDEYSAAKDDLLNFSNKGYANTNTSVFSSIENNTKEDLCALTFVQHQEGKKIQAGMVSLLIPSTLSAFKYGYIQGTVISISKYPASKEAIYAYLGNMSLVDEFFAGGAPFMVKIKLDKNALTPSGLSWTTKKGSSFKIEPGTSVFVKIVNKTSSPFSLLFNKNDS